MRENEKEYLEDWLAELKNEVEGYEATLEESDSKKVELRLQKSILDTFLIQSKYSVEEEKAKFKNHFDYDEISEEYKELNSDEKAEEEAELREKIHFNQIVMERIETILQQINTPA